MEHCAPQNTPVWGGQSPVISCYKVVSLLLWNVVPVGFKLVGENERRSLLDKIRIIKNIWVNDVYQHVLRLKNQI